MHQLKLKKKRKQNNIQAMDGIKTSGIKTRGIKTSVKKRDKLYKQTIKAKNKQQKLIKHESYKKYRNKIIELIRQ